MLIALKNAHKLQYNHPTGKRQKQENIIGQDTFYLENFENLGQFTLCNQDIDVFFIENCAKPIFFLDYVMILSFIL